MIELTTMHPHGVFLRREAVAHGYNDDDLSHAVRTRFLHRVRHGAYVSAALWDSADLVQRHLLRCHAVLATHNDSVALTHTSAAVMHGLDVWPTELLDRVHLTRLDQQTSRICGDIAYHRGRIPEDQLTPMPNGGWTSTPARAAVEHASLTHVEGGVVCLDSFLKNHADEEWDGLRSAYESCGGWPRTRQLRLTLGLARPGAQSVGESRIRYLIWENHLPMPDLQVPVRDHWGNLVGISDFGWDRHKVLGEFDGKVKYDVHLRPGETSADAVFREKRREDLMREYSGCDMIRFIWADLYSRKRTVARIRRALRLPDA